MSYTMLVDDNSYQLNPSFSPLFTGTLAVNAARYLGLGTHDNPRPELDDSTVQAAILSSTFFNNQRHTLIWQCLNLKAHLDDPQIRKFAEIDEDAWSIQCLPRDVTNHKQKMVQVASDRRDLFALSDVDLRDTLMACVNRDSLFGLLQTDNLAVRTLITDLTNPDSLFNAQTPSYFDTDAANTCYELFARFSSLLRWHDNGEHLAIEFTKEPQPAI